VHKAARRAALGVHKSARENDRFSEELLQLIDEVRTASAKAGFYQMCVPESLGGGGLSHLAYYVAWEAMFHHCGPQNWLMLYALAHWAFGPSKLLERVTPEVLERFVPGLMDGTKSMCFAMSEPGAGSEKREHDQNPGGKKWRRLVHQRLENLDHQFPGCRLLCVDGGD
jgi:acyl-CoA dehydrogenase